MILSLQIVRLVVDGGNFGSSPCPNVSINVRVEELDKKSAALVDEAKKLSRLSVSHSTGTHSW